MMSDSELSDDMDELQEIIAEYEAKAKEKQQKSSNVNSDKRKKATPKPAKSPPSSLEVPMDKVIFGDKEGFLKQLAEAVGETKPIKLEAANEVEEEEGEEGEETKRKGRKRKPAWTDADDELIQVGEVKRETRHTGPLDHLRKDKSYKDYLTARFTRIVAQPKWASLERKPKKGSDDEEDEELLQTVGFLAKPAVDTLQPQDLHCKRLKDLNRATYSEGGINSIQFHPTSTAALVAGETGIATIYSIDGRKNEKLHSMRFHDYPIKCAKIAPCGTKAIFGSVKNFYYSYDLLSAQETRYMLPRTVTKLRSFELSACGRYMAVAGRFGMLHLFDAACHELIHSFKQEHLVAGFRFTGDSKHLICNSHSCDVSIFSLQQQRLEHIFTDDGCVAGRALDLSPDQRLLATGSMEGVVNVYDFEELQQTHERSPLPLKCFLNLTTAISDVKFNHSSELLAMSSTEVSSAVKLAHFPSATVYANFPGFKSNLGKIRTLEFSPSSGYLAMGNCSKEVSLFRVKHFQNY